MNKYQVVIPYTGMGHWQAQAHQMKKFNEAGIPYQNYKWTMSSHKDGFDLHDWKIKCTEEQLSFLALSCGAYIRLNLTETYRASGLAKLNEDEKEALGLI